MEEEIAALYRIPVQWNVREGSVKSVSKGALFETYAESDNLIFRCMFSWIYPDCKARGLCPRSVI